MAKHRKEDDTEEDESFSGDIQEGQLRAQLNQRVPPLDRLSEVSLSPIETF